MTRFLRASIIGVTLLLPGTVSSADPTRLAVLYQGTVSGEIEPCGCPTVPIGGLDRKAAFVEKLRAKQAVLLVDAGDLLFPDEPMPPGDAPQRRLKADLILQAHGAMRVDALGLGDQDLAFGVSFLKETGAKYHSPFLSANLVTRKDGKPVFAAHKIVERAGVRIGIFSVMGPKDWRGKPIELGQQWEVRDPTKAATAQVAALQKEKVDYIVALTSQGVDADEAMAKSVPGIDLVVGSHSATRITTPRKIGSTFILQAGLKGERLGMLDYTLIGNPRKSIRKVVDATSDLDLLGDDDDSPARSEIYNEVLELAPDTGTDAKVAPMVLATKKAITALPPPDDVEPVVLEGPLVGVEACRGCHVKEFEHWKSTQHARAYKTLTEWQRQFDFDCVGCHTTGWKKDGGFDNPWAVGPLKNVQCETCHGPGREHARSPKKVKLVVKPEESLCRGCHSVEQTGDRFVFDQYIPKISHQTGS